MKLKRIYKIVSVLVAVLLMATVFIENVSAASDSDEDGINNRDESNIYGTDPNNPDTDDDGLWDGEEVNIAGSVDTIVNTLYDGLSEMSEKTFVFDSPGEQIVNVKIPVSEYALEFITNATLDLDGYLHPRWALDPGLAQISDVGEYSSPALADLDGDGDFDLLIGEGDGVINGYRNAGTIFDPIWVFDSSLVIGIDDVGNNSAPTLADLDGDGYFDLLIGKGDGTIDGYVNNGTVLSPTWVLDSSLVDGIVCVGSNSTPALADLDGDNDNDLFVGAGDGKTYVYMNIGNSSNPIWSIPIVDTKLYVESNSTPAFADLDNDGDYDLLIGNGSGVINGFRNVGNISIPIWSRDPSLVDGIDDIGNNSAPALADLDGDGKCDLLIGELEGVVNGYGNVGKYAANPTLDVGDDGDTDWSYTGEFCVNRTTMDFSNEVNVYIASHPQSTPYIYVPLVFRSDSIGEIKASSINIEVNIITTDPLDPDTDGDGLVDGEEFNSMGSSDIIVNSFLEGSIPYNLTFYSGGEQTVHVNISVSDGALEFVENAKIKLSGLNYSGNYSINPVLDVGNDGDIQWSYMGELTANETILRFSNEINVYITSHFQSSGYIHIPFVFHSDSMGMIKISNLSIRVKILITNPLDPDTDNDGLWDGEELDTDKKGDTIVDSLSDPNDNPVVFESAGNRTVYVSIPVSEGALEFVKNARINLMGTPAPFGHVLDQECYTSSTTDYSCFGGKYMWGQLFTTNGGKLSKVSVAIRTLVESPVDDVYIEVQEDDGSGKPNGIVVPNGETTISKTNVSDDFIWLDATFATPPDLVTNGKYHLVLKSPGSDDEIYDILLVIPGTYPDGHALIFVGNKWVILLYDTAFRTYLAGDSYTTNPTLCVGENEGSLWSYIGEFTTTETTPDFSKDITTYMSSHNDSDDGSIDGYIEVPLVFHSDSGGKINISNISIRVDILTTNPLDIDTDDDFITDNKDSNPVVYTIIGDETIDIDVITVDYDLGVSVAIDYDKSTDIKPIIMSITPRIPLNGSIGKYMDTSTIEESFTAVIKFRYDNITLPINITEKYLRTYSFDGERWTLLLNPPKDEETGVDLENGFVWAKTRHLSDYSSGDASYTDSDSDGLTDAEEANAAGSSSTTITALSDDSHEKTLTFSNKYGGSKTVYVDIPVSDGAIEYIAGATLNIRGCAAFSDDWDLSIEQVDHKVMGLFAAPVPYFLRGHTTSIFDNDIITANDDNTVTMLQWDDGEWVHKTLYARHPNDPDFYDLCIYVGDANNDNSPPVFNEIVTANYFTNTVSVLWYNKNTNEWGYPEILEVGNGPISVFVGDADMDGDNDIVTTNSDSTVSILRWNGAGWDRHMERYVGGARSLFVADANNDGANDIVVANPADDTVSILRGDGYGGWKPRITRVVGQQPVSVFVADVNHDGHNDILTACDYGDGVSILLGNSDNDWDPDGVGVGDSPECVFVADANGDGRGDIVTANYGSYDISIVDGMNWGVKKRIDAGRKPCFVFVEDVDNDGDNDILSASRLPPSESISILTTVYKYPTNPSLNIGDDNGEYEWRYAGEFTVTETAQDFSIEINEYLSSHSDADDGSEDGFVSVPLVFTSYSPGRLRISSIDINVNILVTDPHSSDTDVDGLWDGWQDDGDMVYEIGETKGEKQYAADPTNLDTDGDGFEDGSDDFPLDPDEWLDTDKDEIGNNADNDDDGDGLSDEDENNIYGTEPLDPDSDDDGLNDYEEIKIYSTSPISPDTDSDGLWDGWQDDGDMVYETGETKGEKQYATDPNDFDTDDDGLGDGVEVNTHGTDPNNPDSDDDGMSDSWEVTYDLDPLDSTDASIDSDGDGLNNLEEYDHNTNPNEQDTDYDGWNDYDEVNVYITNPVSADTDNDDISDPNDAFPLDSNMNRWDCDVGSQFDNDFDMNKHNPGVCLDDSWSSSFTSNDITYRDGSVLSGFFLNIQEDPNIDRNTNVKYLITLRYKSTSSVVLRQYYSSTAYVSIGTLPDTSGNWKTISLKSKQDKYYDWDSSISNHNVYFRFSDSLSLDTISVDPVQNYYCDAGASGDEDSAQHSPGVYLSDADKAYGGWDVHTDGNKIGGDGAEIYFHLPDDHETVEYKITFRYYIPSTVPSWERVFQQYWIDFPETKRWRDLGTLDSLSYDTALFIIDNYYDYAGKKDFPLRYIWGDTVLDWIEIVPIKIHCDVGTSGDDDVYQRNPGVSIYPAEWSSHQLVDGREVRSGLSGCNLYFNSPEPGESYSIRLIYKTDSTTDGEFRQWDGATYHSLGTLPGTNGVWDMVSFQVDTNSYYDYNGLGSTFDMNVLFEIYFPSPSPTIYIDEIILLNGLDSDSDGLIDIEETDIYGTDPNNPDTDGDGMPDGWEVQYSLKPLDSSDDVGDPDDDGLPNLGEYNHGTDPQDSDTDDDGLSDKVEIDGWEIYVDDINGYRWFPTVYSSPHTPNSDKDSLSDKQEHDNSQWPSPVFSDPEKEDTDGDGLWDGSTKTVDGLQHIGEDIKGTSPWKADTDGDRLADGWDDVNRDGVRQTDEEKGELQYGTDPNNSDSDGDSLNDREEIITHGTDPLKKDTDDDKLSDDEEINTYGTDPTKPDTDTDSFSDFSEIYGFNTDPCDSDLDTDSDCMPDDYEYECGIVKDGWQNPNIHNNRYAVLIVGGDYKNKNYAAFWNDLIFMYDILVDEYGYVDDQLKGFSPATDHIAVIYADGNVPSTTNCIDWTLIHDEKDIIDYSATKSNISSVFTELGDVMGSNDFLFVYFNDHGTNYDENNNVDLTHRYFSLWDFDLSDGVKPRIRDDDFAINYVGKITKYAREVFVIEACKSGGFTDDLSKSDRVIITSCTKMEYSTPGDGYAADRKNAPSIYAPPSNDYGEFTYHLQCALYKRFPNGTAVNADSNGDGYVSMVEAFNYAASHDSLDGQLCDPNHPMFGNNDIETPQYDDNGDGFSYQYRDANGTLQGLLPYEGDGSLGCSTFL